jgi:hypothetical protein
MSPMNRKLYPPEWKRIAHAVKVAADWRCQCTGECGRDHDGQCVHVHLERDVDTGRRVILTVAHLDHDPENPAARLAALCAPCHLRYDNRHRAELRRSRQ